MKPIHLTVFVLWGALCFSLVMYVVLLNLMSFSPEKEAHESLTGLFALVAGMAAAMSFVLRKVMLGKFSEGKMKVDGFTDRNLFVAGNLVVFALSESVGVLGFVNGLTSRGEVGTWLPFIGGSLILLLLHIPLPSRFEKKKTDGYLR